MPVSERGYLQRDLVIKMLIDIIVMINSLLSYIHNIGFDLLKDTFFSR